MANMSYCRMRNTEQDLSDAYNNWDETQSQEELRARKHILELARLIIRSYDEEFKLVKLED